MQLIFINSWQLVWLISSSIPNATHIHKPNATCMSYLIFYSQCNSYLKTQCNLNESSHLQFPIQLIFINSMKPEWFISSSIPNATHIHKPIANLYESSHLQFPMQLIFINQGRNRTIFLRGQSHFSWFFPRRKMFFPVENFHFGRPRTNFSGFEKWKAKKKQNKTKQNNKTTKQNKTKKQKKKQNKTKQNKKNKTKQNKETNKTKQKQKRSSPHIITFPLSILNFPPSILQFSFFSPFYTSLFPCLFFPVAQQIPGQKSLEALCPLPPPRLLRHCHKPNTTCMCHLILNSQCNSYSKTQCNLYELSHLQFPIQLIFIKPMRPVGPMYHLIYNSQCNSYS